MLEQTLNVMVMNWMLIVISVYAGRAIQVAKTADKETVEGKKLRKLKMRKAFIYLFFAIFLALVSSVGHNLNSYQKGQVQALKGQLEFKYDSSEFRYVRCLPYNTDTIVVNRNLKELNDFQKK
jgi:hypothetical protein